jgi:hypothetical protein
LGFSVSSALTVLSDLAPRWLNFVIFVDFHEF